MALFTVKNFTQYNTEDIEALIFMIEEFLSREGYSFSPQVLWRNGSHERDTVIFVKDYSPSSSFREFTRWEGGKMVSVKERRFVKEGRSDSAKGIIRILPPHKLWLTPEEALASCAGEGGDVLPKEAQDKLVRKLFSFYQYTVNGAPPRYAEEVRCRDDVVLLTSGMRVRFDKKRRAEGKEEKIRVARIRGDKVLYSAIHYSERTRREVERIAREVNRYSRIKNLPDDINVPAIGLEITMVREHLERIIGALKRAKERSK